MTFYQVDAFAERPFTGNPAAVCILPEPRDTGWMQQVAREMNLSETAFLVGRDQGYDLRWFTPAAEVDLCGHATLASAHVLWEIELLRREEPARFLTKSGLLTAWRQGEHIVMDFPAEPAKEAALPEQLARALGTEPVYVGRNRMDYLIELSSAAEVRGLRPDLTLLATVPARGVIVTAPSDDTAYDFVSRFFAPRVGVPEDPVTGSAHCCLGPHWAGRLQRTELRAYQASDRGGTVSVRVDGDRVHLGGRAVTVMVGRLLAGV